MLLLIWWRCLSSFSFSCNESFWLAHHHPHWCNNAIFGLVYCWTLHLSTNVLNFPKQVIIFSKVIIHLKWKELQTNLSTMFEFIEKLVFRKFLQSLKEYRFLDGLESYQHAPLVCSSMLYVLPLLLFHNYNNNKSWVKT